MTSPQDPFAAPGDPPPAGGQQPPPPPGYPPPYAPAPYGARKTNTLAIVGFILTLAVCPPVGAVLCFIALGQIKQTGEGGRGLALAGIWICVGLIVVFLGAFALAALVGGASTGY